jgi:uncharacterized protein (TIGR03905 family)
MKTICYVPIGICASVIEIEVQDNIVVKVNIAGGCEGLSKGLARLVEGMQVEEVIARLEGIKCQQDTSCPDQLAQALKTMLSA